MLGNIIYSRDDYIHQSDMDNNENMFIAENSPVKDYLYNTYGIKSQLMSDLTTDDAVKINSNKGYLLANIEMK